MIALLPRLLTPAETVIKNGSLVRLKFLDGNKAALLYGKSSFERSGGLQKATDFLKAAKIEVIPVSGVAGGTSFSVARDIASRLSDESPDWIIACGGGAVMDCAKLVWVFYEYPDCAEAVLEKPNSIPPLRSKAKLACIPTASGSGSEASIVAVAADAERKRKIPVVSQFFMPDCAILDPSLTAALPVDLTAAAAMDAFVHAVESFCSRINNELTNSLCVAAGTLIRECLPTALDDPRSMPAREKLMYAAYLAGIAQNMTSVGAVHALSHAMESSAGLAHGLGNAIFLPHVLTRNAKKSSRPKDFAKAAGFGSLEGIISWTERIMRQSQLSAAWKKTVQKGIDMEAVAEKATQDICIRTNPVALTADDLVGILKDAC